MAKTQKERIYDLLEERGEQGATNIELNEICFRYGGRLHELRQESCRIRTTHVKGPVFRFTLLESDEPQYQDFLELLRPSNCCGEIVVDGMCGGCHEHI
ncbi:hypothetical protein [Arthrobacter sp. OY3WO11]|uniref:hypothetical protein n=1 Tax=Arthrobacter sp. OY3WO11 TaxID=1835723 RepID=UPI0007CF028C|nr:hypothetical protein [Arthrobacter sp. OY3WO11]OAE01884.1 hypothetical protein A6A22_10985 [Arthrobacter sp. OY3WO11]